MLHSKAAGEQDIMKGPREWDVEDPATMNVSDLCAAKAEFSSAKAVSVS